MFSLAQHQFPNETSKMTHSWVAIKYWLEQRQREVCKQFQFLTYIGLEHTENIQLHFTCWSVQLWFDSVFRCHYFICTVRQDNAAQSVCNCFKIPQSDISKTIAFVVSKIFRKCNQRKSNQTSRLTLITGWYDVTLETAERLTWKLAQCLTGVLSTVMAVFKNRIWNAVWVSNLLGYQTVFSILWSSEESSFCDLFTVQ